MRCCRFLIFGKSTERSIEISLPWRYRSAAGQPRKVVVMAFIQMIEFTTTQPDAVEALVAEWRTQTTGRRTAQRGTFTRDRERQNTYLQIVEFPSYEDAMANSDLPETASFAERVGQLCDGAILFRNLDVRSIEEL
jgi:hypothetical protein